MEVFVGDEGGGGSGPVLVSEREAHRAALLCVLKVAYATGQQARVVWIGMTLYHRFFAQVSLREYPPCLFAVTCLMAASKLTDHPCNLRDLLNAYHAVQYPAMPPPELGTRLTKLKESIILQEQMLLRVLRFSLETRTPHIFVLHYFKTFGFSTSALRVAYAMLSDSLSSSACLAFPVHVLAAASLASAARLLGETVTSSVAAVLPAHRKWYSLCDVTDRQMADASALLLSLYNDIAK